MVSQKPQTKSQNKAKKRRRKAKHNKTAITKGEDRLVADKKSDTSEVVKEVGVGEIVKPKKNANKKKGNGNLSSIINEEKKSSKDDGKDGEDVGDGVENVTSGTIKGEKRKGRSVVKTLLKIEKVNDKKANNDLQDEKKKSDGILNKIEKHGDDDDSLHSEDVVEMEEDEGVVIETDEAFGDKGDIKTVTSLGESNILNDINKIVEAEIEEVGNDEESEESEVVPGERKFEKDNRDQNGKNESKRTGKMKSGRTDEGKSLSKKNARLSESKVAKKIKEQGNVTLEVGSGDELKEEKSIGMDNDNKAFSDENKSWLKPVNANPDKKKQQLLSDDDDEMVDDDNFDDNESNSDETASSLLSIERQASQLDHELEEEKKEAEAELSRTIAQQTEVYHLPTAEEDKGADHVLSPPELRERIGSVLEVLADFKSRREPGRSRVEYVERLSADLTELFGYLPELVDYFLSMFGPNETMEFLEKSDEARPMVLRTNTLKARRKDLAQALIKRGVVLDPLADWSKVGLLVYQSPVPLGATPEYLAGHYMLQSAASLCPVLALDVQPNQRVLDVSSAPGGKTSYICQLLKNTGTVLASDLSPVRQKATVANLHRLGVRNAIVAVHDGRKLGTLMKNSFDRVLLDAPCSGLGVISRDPSVKIQRTMNDIKRNSHLQKELLLSAIDALNTKEKGGIMVYSTCSVSTLENEEVVQYALRRRKVKIMDSGLDFGKPGFTRYNDRRYHPSMAMARRFYPHVHNMDGFFVCKLRKLSTWKLEEQSPEEQRKVVAEEKEEAETMGTKEVKTENEDSIMEDTHSEKIDVNKKKKRKEIEKAKKGVVSTAKSFKDKYSVPPRNKKKKKSTNAKVTKPRQIRIPKDDAKE